MNLWHSITIAVSAVNVLIAICIIVSGRKKPENRSALLLAMGLIFISVALYRTIFVSSYPNRLAWYDTIFNSPFLVRCLAVFAELSFNGMIVLILYRLGKDLGIDKQSGGKLLTALPLIGLGCIFAAQFFAFHGLITQYLTTFAIEETLWAVAFALYTPMIVVALVQSKKQNYANKRARLFLILIAIWCGGYLAFQCFYALPFIHYAELSQDIGKVIPPNALQLAISGFVQTRDFDTWGGIGFFIWHSGYFSICSWLSLLFMTVRVGKKGRRSAS